jgi:hypothetical protein
VSFTLLLIFPLRLSHKFSLDKKLMVLRASTDLKEGISFPSGTRTLVCPYSGLAGILSEAPDPQD